eukprot:sb/3473937/
MDECYSIIGHLKVDEDDRDRVASLVSINSAEKSNSDDLASMLTSHLSARHRTEKTEEDAFSDTYNHISDSINYDTDENGISTNTWSSSVMSCSNVTMNWQKVTILPEQSVPYDRAYEEEDEQDTDIGEHKSVIMSLLGELSCPF